MKSGMQPRDLLKQYPGATQKALTASANRLGRSFTENITKVKWPWKDGEVVTKRKNGERVTSPRNIVDLGDLKRSQTREQLSPTEIKWTWEVDYSALVHEGADILKNGSSYPKRPWTKDAELEVKPLEYFADILRRELDG